MTESKFSAGHAIVASLEAHAVQRVYEVPGESFLDVLDGLYETSIQTIICRQEGGASYAAEAEGKLTRRPGVAMVTRGPGASNAMIGIHQAWQDATPMVLFIGLIPVADRRRESFQEFDIDAWFGSTTKKVFVLDKPERASQVVADAFFVAASGRPGPVVVGLPEDVIREQFTESIVQPLYVAAGAVSAHDAEVLRAALDASSKPLVVTGGNDWSSVSAAALTTRLEALSIPAASEWRAAGVISSDSSIYVGSIGYGRTWDLKHALDDADLVITIGTMLGDVGTDGYQLRSDPAAQTIVVSIDDARQGHFGAVTHQILARPDIFTEFLETADITPKPEWDAWRTQLRAAQEVYASLPSVDPVDGPARMSSVFAHLVPELPADAIVTYGAGNHAGWAQKYVPTRQYPSQISTRNGSMGYSIPSAVATCLTFPDRLVVTVAGDGELMMNAQELATAHQYGAKPLIIVMDNGQFGTIRSHQEGWYPKRVSGTQLQNPDFAKLAEAFGGLGIRVEHDHEVGDAVSAALKAVREDGMFALIQVVVDPAVLAPPTD